LIGGTKIQTTKEVQTVIGMALVKRGRHFGLRQMVKQNDPQMLAEGWGEI